MGEVVPPRLIKNAGAMPFGYFGGSVNRTGIDDDDLVGNLRQAFQARGKMFFFVLDDEGGCQPGAQTLGFVMTYCLRQRPGAPSGRTWKR